MLPWYPISMKYDNKKKLSFSKLKLKIMRNYRTSIGLHSRMIFLISKLQYDEIITKTYITIIEILKKTETICLKYLWDDSLLYVYCLIQ